MMILMGKLKGFETSNAELGCLENLLCAHKQGACCLLRHMQKEKLWTGH